MSGAIHPSNNRSQIETFGFFIVVICCLFCFVLFFLIQISLKEKEDKNKKVWIQAREKLQQLTGEIITATLVEFRGMSSQFALGH